MREDDIISVEFQESPIPLGTFRKIDEVLVRRDGCVWIVHKTDVDPFPSSPHAHNPESGLKMHLGNGSLYFGSRDTGKSVDRKHLLFIRAELERKGVILPLVETG